MDVQIEVNGRVRAVSVELQEGVYRVTIDGVERRIDAAAVDPSTLSMVCLSDGQRTSQEVGVSDTGLPGEIAVHVRSGVVSARVITGAASRFGRGAAASAHGAGAAQILAPMPGKVVKVLVKVGDEVKARQGLVVVEAMKMENELRAPKDGRVTEVFVTEGVSVEAGRPLVVVE